MSRQTVGFLNALGKKLGLCVPRPATGPKCLFSCEERHGGGKGADQKGVHPLSCHAKGAHSTHCPRPRATSPPPAQPPSPRPPPHPHKHLRYACLLSGSRQLGIATAFVFYHRFYSSESYTPRLQLCPACNHVHVHVMSM